jgi:hypothetical protein
VDDTIVPPIDKKQPANMPPKKVNPGGMRIGLMVTVLMVHSMDRDPSRRRILKCTDSANRDEMLEPLGAFKTSVSQQPMVTDRYPEPIKEDMGGDPDTQTAPRKEAWKKRQNSQQVDGQQ